MAYGTVNADIITTSTGQTLGAGNATAFKNRIINGAMTIDQRNAGASVTTSSLQTTVYTVDRWNYYNDVVSKRTIQQSSVAPPGFRSSLKVTVIATDTVGPQQFIRQVIEGYNIADLNWGTANAQPVVLSFWVRSSVTGQHGGAVQSNTTDQCFPFAYTISVADTWEYKTINITGPTTGTWGYTNGAGIAVQFENGVGYQKSPASAWIALNATSSTGSVNLCATNGATWYITGIQFEVGTQATSFDYRDYGRELIMCQRYFQRVGPNNGYQEHYALGPCRPAEINTLYAYKVTMRSAPSVTVNDYTLLNVFNGAGITATCVGYVESYISPTTCLLGISVANGTFTAGTSGYVYLANGATISFSSEF